MTTIAHRELRNNSSDILRRVQAGESFEVTNHGEVVAILGPAESVRHHRLSSRRAKGGSFADLEPVTLDHPIQETLDFLRGDV